MICATLCVFLAVGLSHTSSAIPATQDGPPELTSPPAFTSPPELSSPPIPSGLVLAFLAAPHAQQAADPAVVLPFESFEARAGDVLCYSLRVPNPAYGPQGIEVAYGDGRRTPAPVAGQAGSWREIRAPLHAGGTVQTLELVARGSNGAQIGYQVDDVRIERADGSTIDVFRDELVGPRRSSGLETSAGVAVVALDDRFGPAGVATSADVGDPWAAIDLTAMRALEREADPLANASFPRGLTWTGPAIPLRFAREGERSSFAARGQQIGFEPLDGGRFYELWLAVVNTTDTPFDTEIEIQAVDRNVETTSLRVPARESNGYAPGASDGYPARDFALLEIDIASGVSLQSMRLPDDPRLRVLALTIAWRRDGAADPRFRERRLARAALPGTTGTDLSDEDRTEIALYLANRRAAAIFGGVQDQGPRERALFQSLIAKDTQAFRTQLTQLLAAQRDVAQGRKSARIDLIATVPRATDDLVAARELAAALADGVLPEGIPVIAGDAAVLEVLARRDPASLARLAELVRSGGWRTFGTTFDERSTARLGASGLARKLVLAKHAEAEWIESASGIERFSGDLGRMQNLPQLLAAAGTRVVLLGDVPNKPAAPIAVWESSGSQVLTFSPTVRVEGPLRFEANLWRNWTSAATSEAGRPPIPVLCDVSASVARETRAFAADLQGSDLAPEIAWSALADVVEAARERARRWNTPPLAPLDRATLHAELTALAAVRNAERELERWGVVESLATLEGAPEPGAELTQVWRELIDAVDLDASSAEGAARAIAAKAVAGSTRRLARIQSAAPPRGEGVALAVIDVVTWPRTSYVEVQGSELRVASAAGDLPAQRTANGGVLVEFAGSGTTPTALLVRRDPLTELSAPRRVRLEGWTVRTDDLEVAIDPKKGRIERLRITGQDIDLLADGGDRLTWVGNDGTSEPIDALQSIEYVERGPLRAVVRTVHASARARVETEFRVTPGAFGLEIRTSATLLDRTGDVVASLPLRHATPNALVSIPLGAAAIAASASDLRALDGWVAATDGRATTALLGESGIAFRWNERTFDVVLAEAGADVPRTAAFRVLGTAGAWKAAGLDAALLECVQSPVRVGYESTAPPARERDALVRLARIEHDGRRTTGRASGILPIAIEPGPDSTIDIRFVEVRGEPARVQLDFAREPFGARRVDLVGKSLGASTVTGRSLDVTVPAGQFETVRVRVGP